MIYDSIYTILRGEKKNETESYEAFLNSGITSVNIQGMDIPKRDWEYGAMYQIGGEDPKGEFLVFPNGDINPDNGNFTPNGTYFISISVRIPIDNSGYKITAGKGSSHTEGASEDLKITCDGALEDLVSISVDGTVIDNANYTLESGSTILTLKATYLNTLSAGSHTVTFTYKDGQSASADFSIAKPAQVTTNEQTTNRNPYTQTQIREAYRLYMSIKKVLSKRCLANRERKMDLRVTVWAVSFLYHHIQPTIFLFVGRNFIFYIA